MPMTIPPSASVSLTFLSAQQACTGELNTKEVVEDSGDLNDHCFLLMILTAVFIHVLTC